MEKIGSSCGLKTLQKLCNKIKIQQDFTVVQAKVDMFWKRLYETAHLNV